MDKGDTTPRLTAAHRRVQERCHAARDRTVGVSDGTQSDSAHFSTHTRMLVPFVQGLDTGAAAMQKGALAEYRDDSFQSSGTVRLST